MTVRLHTGDAVEQLRHLPDASVQCVVTSPPYFGLRDYGIDGQIGLEESLPDYLSRIAHVFREIARVLRDDGTVWLNLGDSYAGSWGAQGRSGQMADRSVVSARQIEAHPQGRSRTGSTVGTGYKSKDLMGIPWRVAFALQDDGWYLRQDIIWHKPNPMPESVGDRCTKAHEYLFLLSKSPRYYFDQDAIKEIGTGEAPGNTKATKAGRAYESDEKFRTSANLHEIGAAEFRNKRSVWTVSTRPYSGAHFATFPPALIDPCIRAGAAVGDTVLDPFAGSGTTGYVADYLQRHAVLIELNSEYEALIRERFSYAGLFDPLEVCAAEAVT